MTVDPSKNAVHKLASFKKVEYTIRKDGLVMNSTIDVEHVGVLCHLFVYMDERNFQTRSVKSKHEGLLFNQVFLFKISDLCVLRLRFVFYWESHFQPIKLNW